MKININNKAIKAAVLATMLSAGAVSVGYSVMKKDVTLVVNGKESQVSTFENNVKELLSQEEIKYDNNDKISLPLNKEIKDGDKVVVTYRDEITLTIAGKSKEVLTTKSKVEEILAEQKVKYDNDDIIKPALGQEVTEGDKLEVIEVETETLKENKEIPFDTKTEDDKTLAKGKTKVKVEGKVGSRELVYSATYHNGKLIEKSLVEEKVVTEPVDKIVRKGTKIDTPTSTSRGETTRNPESTSKPEVNSGGAKNISVVSTAYCTGSITSTGTKPRWGVIAVDPRVIPYGTKVYIPQFDMVFRAEDTGGAIKGNKIDIYMNSKSQAVNWGRRTIDIQILK